MPHGELHYLTIAEAGALIRSRKLSPVELTRAFLDRIEQLDDTLQSYITVLEDGAMAEARSAESAILRDGYIGPLHGIPIALKDLYDTAGIRTTAGSRVMADRVPTEDATATARLKSSGAVLLGKLAMSELAMGGPDPTNGFPIPRNPWNLEHSPGGSSSGSAASVAAGLCMGSLGSCTRGSIRAPASFCGMVGLKPTYGRVSRHGVVPLSWTLDHCGPMTWTVEDAAIMLHAIAGRDPRDLTSSRAPVPPYSESLREDVAGLRIGVPRHFFFAEHPEVDRESQAIADSAIATLGEMGAQVREVEVPALRYADAAALVIILGEGFAYHERDLLTRPQDFGELDRNELRVGGLFGLADYVQAQRARSVLRRQYHDVLAKVDVIASPTSTMVAPRFDAGPGAAITRMPSFTGPYNLTGLPAISVPCGFTSAGLPVGLQLAGRPFDEATVLRAAYAYQQHARLFERRPPV